MDQTAVLQGLAPHVRVQAEGLLAQFGDVLRITSGYRDLQAQARAMATHVMQNRTWINETYRRIGRPSYEVGQFLQRLVDQHPDWRSHDEIAEGLWMQLTHDPRGSLISKHCVQVDGVPAALAFDLDPLEHDGSMTAMGQEVWQAILALPGLDPPPLRREGGRVIWHVQFLPVMGEPATEGRRHA